MVWYTNLPLSPNSSPLLSHYHGSVLDTAIERVTHLNYFLPKDLFLSVNDVKVPPPTSINQPWCISRVETKIPRALDRVGSIRVTYKHKKGRGPSDTMSTDPSSDDPLQTILTGPNSTSYRRRRKTRTKVWYTWVDRMFYTFCRSSSVGSGPSVQPKLP